MNFRVTTMELLNYNLLILVGPYQLEWSYPRTSDLFQEKAGFPKRLFEVTQSLSKFEVIQAIFWKIIKSFILLWERRNFFPELFVDPWNLLLIYWVRNEYHRFLYIFLYELHISLVVSQENCFKCLVFFFKKIVRVRSDLLWI